MPPDIDDLDPRGVLLAVEEARREELAAQARTLALAAHWCDLHGQFDYDDEGLVARGAEQLIGLGGPGTPEVEEFAAAEFGAMRHQHPLTARSLLADALDLRHRLPHVWAAVHALRIEAWVARKIASLTRKLSAAAAAYVDAAIADHLDSLPTGRLLALVEAAILRADPALAELQHEVAEETRFVRTTAETHGMKMLLARAAAGDVIVFAAMTDRIAELLARQGDADPADVRRAKAIGILAHPAEALRLLLEAAHDEGVPDATAEAELAGSADAAETLRGLLKGTDPEILRPQTRLFVHVTDEALARSEGVARVEGVGPVIVQQVGDWLARSTVTVTPVLDLADQRPVDGYEFPPRLREAAHQLAPAEPFPWSTSTSRRRDADHCSPYVPNGRGGAPGQTRLGNLALLTRHHHRIKTHGGWQVVCLSPGRFRWRSPHGFSFLVDHLGTRRLPDHLIESYRPVDDPRHSAIEERLADLLARVT